MWQNYEESSELNELGIITKDAVKDWRDTLLVFRLKVDKKYGASLSKDCSKKVMWLREKEDILQLRKKLHIFNCRMR